MSKEKFLSVGVIVLVVLAIGGWAMFGRGNKEVTPPVAKVDSAVTVNGVAIPKSTYDTQLATVIASYKTQGVNTEDATKLAEIKKQIIDGLVNNEILKQGIASAGIKIDPSEVEKKFQEVLTSAGGADKLKEALATNNLTEAQLRENISNQLATQAYLLKNVDISTATATDEEITTFYNEYKKANKDAPVLKDLKEQIRQQIITNKQNVLVNNFIASLREKSKVEVSPTL